MKIFRLPLILAASLFFFNSCGGGSAANFVNRVAALTITSSAPPTGMVGLVYGGGSGFSLSASGGIPPYSWSWAAGPGASLPPGLSVSGNVITGTPTSSGSFTVIVTVTDSEPVPARASATYTITIAPSQLTIASGTPPNGTVGISYGTSSGFPLSASGGLAPYIWSWVAASGSSLPPGLSISGNTVSGIPTTAGTFVLTVTVIDSEPVPAQASATYTIVIAGSQGGLTITSGVPPDGTVDVAYDRRAIPCVLGQPGCICFRRVCRKIVNGFSFSASGGSGTYIWAVSNLPPGLSLSNNTIGGTPASGSAGTYNLHVSVTDSATPPNVTNAIYPIHISPPPPPIIVNQPVPYSPTKNSAYTFTFTATDGQAPLTWSETGLLPPGLRLSSSGVLSGTPTAIGSFPITVTAQDSANQTSAPEMFTLEVFLHGFTPTGNMTSARVLHAASLLNNGKVLITGGDDGSGNILATAELFDPSVGTFTATTNMSGEREHHTSTVLNTGKVLVTGGGPLAAELFDPATGHFNLTGNMTTSRSSARATLLGNGKVLITGGTNNGISLATAEVYDPATGTFSATGSMVSPRSRHTAVLLGNGKVLLAGGFDASGQPLLSAELFDPSTLTFAATGSMSTARAEHNASLLANGQVLVEGGMDASSTPVNTAEIFNSGTGSFATTGAMTAPRDYHTSTLLLDGTVLITGPDQTTEFFNATTGTFLAAATMTVARESHTATLLKDGTVLITGGHTTTINSAVVAVGSAELYK